MKNYSPHYNCCYFDVSCKIVINSMKHLYTSSNHNDSTFPHIIYFYHKMTFLLVIIEQELLYSSCLSSTLLFPALNMQVKIQIQPCLRAMKCYVYLLPTSYVACDDCHRCYNKHCVAPIFIDQDQLY